MRSKTSFFNPTLFWKNTARFWPVWAVYALFWFVAYPVRGLSDLRSGRWDGALGMDTESAAEIVRYSFHWDLLNCAETVVVVAVLFGILTAMALFSYLYQGRSACMLHSLPVRREGLFLTNYLSGIAFFLVPNTVIALLTLLVELAAGDVVLWALGVWWLQVNAACLFFFSFAVFCAMFTGHILALPAFYFILNFLAYGLGLLLDQLLRQSLYGFYGFSDESLLLALTPALSLTSAMDWYIVNGTLEMAGPGAVAIYALVGLALAGVALILYRRRQMETAGDVVSVSWVRPVFQYGVALCAGLTFGAATWAVVELNGILSLWVCIMLWAAIGCFAAEMLLKKSFRVLGGWKKAAAAALAVLVCCVVIEADLFGYESRVPAADQVDWVVVDGIDSAPYDRGSGLYANFSEPEQIALVTSLHRAITEYGEEDPQADTTRPAGELTADWVRLEYRLKDGSTLKRNYAVLLAEGDLESPGTVTGEVNALLNDRSVVELAYQLDQLADYTAATAELSGISENGAYEDIVKTEEEAQKLWEAVKRDFAEGTLGRRYLFDLSEVRKEHCYYNDLRLYLTTIKVDEKTGERYVEDTNFVVTLTPDARNTLAALKELGVLDRVELRTFGDVIREEEAQKYGYDEKLPYTYEVGEYGTAYIYAETEDRGMK